jgi:RNA polymerase sigma-70 factor (ECF subfamily)
MFTSENLASGQADADSFIAVNQSAKVHLDSETLVQMVKSKSESGFNILYDNYGGAIYGIVMKFVQRKEIADDLLHEIFIITWKNIDAYDPEKGTLFRWMLNIARNQAIDYLRSSCHSRQLLQLNNDLLTLQEYSINSKAINSNEVLFKDNKSKVLKLDTKYADVIDLIFFYGCTYEQTARIMKLALGAVKIRARKGLGLLKILNQQYNRAAS